MCARPVPQKRQERHRLTTKSISVVDGLAVIYQREHSSVWQVRVKLDDRRWHRYSTGEHDQRKAAKAAIKLFYEKEFKRENKLPQSTRRFGAVADAVVRELQEAVDGGLGKSVYKDYIVAINKYLKPFFKNYSLDSFKSPVLQKFDEWRLHQMGKKPKASTITTHNSALNKVFDYAERYGWITAAVRPKLTNKGAKTSARPAFSLAEYRTLVRKLPHWAKKERKGEKAQSKMMRELLRDYVLVLANTGIRHGTEANSLKWSDVEFWKSEDKQTYLRLSVKGKTGRRSLIARDGTETYLKRIQERFNELGSMTFEQLLKKKLQVPVFRLASGDTTTNLNQTFEQFLKDSGLLFGVGSDAKRTLYSLRHTYATLQLMDGRGIHELAKQMGTSVQMLEQHYSKITPELMAYEFASRGKTEARKSRS
jgi:integrase